MNIEITKTKLAVLLGAGVLVAGGATGAAIAVDDDDDRPLTGTSLQKAKDAALAHTGGGRVTDTESNDEESQYEVEVTLEDGSHVDVQLDGDFEVVGSETDGPEEEDD